MQRYKTIAAMAVAAVLAVSAAYLAISNLADLKVEAEPKESGTLAEAGKAATPESITDDQSAMLERGNIAMGFDQYKIMHHFMATPSGGQIMIVGVDSNDADTISQIKTHVLDIQQEFSQGNFTKPFFIHAQEVPGTAVMAEKKDMIRYSVEELDNGSILVLTTDDEELIQAIQQFMEFQNSEHSGH